MAVWNIRKFAPLLIKVAPVSVALLLCSLILSFYYINKQYNREVSLSTELLVSRINGYVKLIDSRISSDTSHTTGVSIPIQQKDFPEIRILSVATNGYKTQLLEFPPNKFLLINNANPSITLPFRSAILCNNNIWLKHQTATGNGKLVTYAVSLKELIVFLEKEYGLHTGLNGKASKLLSATSFNPKWSAKAPLFRLYNLNGQNIGTLTLQVKNYPIAVMVLVGLIHLFLLLVFIAVIAEKKDLREEEVTEPNILSNLSQLQGVLNSYSKGVRIIDKQFRVVAINSAFSRFTGLKEDEIVGKQCFDIYNSINCHTTNCPLIRINSCEQEINEEEYRYHKNGKKSKVSIRSSALYTGETPIGIIQEFEDVAKREELEESLRQSELYFEIFINSLPFGVFIQDGITKNIIYQNSYLNQITNNTDFHNYMVESKDITLSDKGFERPETLEIIDHNGKWRFFEFSQFKFLGQQNQIRIGGILVDVTRRKEVEHYRDVLSMAIENSPVSVLILSRDNEVEYFNPSFTELTGLNLATAYSKELVSLDIEYGTKQRITLALEIARTGKNWQGEIQLIKRNGDKNWISASFIPLLNSSKQLQHTVVIMENITTRKEYEKELIMAKSKAEESDRLKSVFLSNLSHEIRTPLNAIIGFSTLLFDGDLSFNERKNISDTIYKNSNDLLKLIENLIDISEIETGNLTIQKNDFSVNSLMNDLYRQLIDEDKKASNVRLSLRKEVNWDNLTIHSDKLRIKQVLTHLLSNSCKFTEKGFIEFGYTLKDESTLMFYVIDSGIGIEPDKQSIIFNPFRQVDESSTRHYGGMGLGLAISKHIVEKLGGRIWLTSTPGSGTNVFFTIPYIPVNSKFERPVKRPIYTNFNWDSKTILITDDIDANYVYLKSALKKTNAKIIWARNGKEAVEIVKSSAEINLILMDLIMPEMDGYEATRCIKAMNKEIPIIGQTAYPNANNAEKANESGFDTILEKPIRIQRMLLELNRFLSN